MGMAPHDLQGWFDALAELRGLRVHLAEAPPVADPTAISIPADLLAALRSA